MANEQQEIERLREFLSFIAKDEHACGNADNPQVFIDECSCQPWSNALLAEGALEGLTLEQAKERARLPFRHAGP